MLVHLSIWAPSVSASSGEMGGTVSHEWQLPAPAGEDALQLCVSCRRAYLSGDGKCQACGDTVEGVSSVEVG